MFLTPKNPVAFVDIIAIRGDGYEDAETLAVIVTTPDPRVTIQISEAIVTIENSDSEYSGGRIDEGGVRE